MLPDTAIPMAAPTSREASLTADATPCFSGGVPLMMAAVAGAVETEPGLDVRGLVGLADSMAGIGADDVVFGTVPVAAAPGDPARVVADGERAERLFAQLRPDE